MTRKLIIVIVSLTAMLLGACASTPPSRFYALEPVSTNSDKQADAVVIGMGPFSFPEYLMRPQIVTRTSGSELKMAEFDRWAEPLDKAFLRNLAMSVDAMVNTAVIVPVPYSGLVDIDLRLLGRVLRFDVDDSGTAVLQVQWGAGKKKNVVIKPQSATYTAKAADPEDYDSVVLALNETVTSFSRDVADVLTAAIAQMESMPE